MGHVIVLIIAWTLIWMDPINGTIMAIVIKIL